MSSKCDITAMIGIIGQSCWLAKAFLGLQPNRAVTLCVMKCTCQISANFVIMSL